MSLEIPSACARLPFCVSRLVSLHVCKGPTPSEGATCLLLLREMMWSVPIWAGLGQAGVGAGSQRPQVAVAVDPSAWLLHVFCDPACTLLWGQNGTEPSRRTLGQGYPDLGSIRWERKGQGLIA